MSPFVFGQAVRVELGGVDISEYVAGSGFELDPWQRDMLTMTMDNSTAVFKPKRRVLLRFRGRWHGPTHLIFFDEIFHLGAARRARLSAMRSAYRRRRT